MGKAREYIISTLLLALIFVGGTGVLSNYLMSCNNSSCSSERHHCCHCTQHMEDCKNHSQEVDHDCIRKYSLSLEFVTPANSNNNTINSVVLYPTDIALFSVHFSDRYIEYIGLFYPRLDEDLISNFDPSQALLRAPPAFV